MPFAADWNHPDGGTAGASAWVNELYDGLMATYEPASAAVADCATVDFANYASGIPRHGSACLVIADLGDGTAVFGVRPLGLYLVFDVGTNRVRQVYNFWLGGVPSCSTPQAALERGTSGSIAVGGYLKAQKVLPLTIASVTPMQGYASPNGLTNAELDMAYGCNGQSFAPPDNGYGGMKWGAGSGAIASEYNLDSGVNYKVFAQQGYYGTMQFSDADGGAYTLGVGAATFGTTAIKIDWTSAATANPAITTISNAWWEYNCTAAPDTDCAAAGDCTIVPDDGNGHSLFTLTAGANMVNNYCGVPVQDVTVVFPKGSSTPSQIYVTNPGGK